MRLLIIRHAVAVPRGTPDMPDDDRPLTARGRKRFRRAARGLAAAVGRPDVILTSPLPRARKTAEIAAKAWGKLKPVDTPALAGGTFEELAVALAPYGDKDTVAIVGHEPDVSEMLARLLATPQTDRLTFRKGGAALVEVSGPLQEGGTLLWYVPPRLLRLMS
jgi:phosphohistidine phosphatase